MFSATLLPRFALLALSLVAFGACHVTPYQRALPEWLQKVYVPMVSNQTYEPGLEEIITKSLQAEILSDGRLDVVQKSKADAVVQVNLLDFEETTSDFESDNIASRKQMSVQTEIKVFDPRDMDNPIGSVAPFKIALGYRSDYRSSSAELDVDARARLGETAALQILRALMSQIQMKNP